MRFLAENVTHLILVKAWRFWGYLRASARGVAITDIAAISPNARFGRRVKLGKVQIASDVSIGDGTYINGGIIASGRIGRFCSVATNVLIGPFDHNYRLPVMSSTLMDQGIAKAAPVIGDDVWIGANVVILRGVTIGNGAVIGAGSVVTRNVPPYTIAAGVPCKVLRRRFATSQEQRDAEACLADLLKKALE